MHLGRLVPGNSTARRYLTLALVLGFSYAIVNPPFAVNDERAHWLRVYEMSKGRFLSRTDAEGPYHWIPTEYRDLIVRYARVQRRAEGRIDERQVLNDLVHFERKGKWERHVANAAGYNIIAYLPHFPAVWLARVLNLPALWQVYLARFAAVINFAVLSSWAVAIAGRAGWIFFALGLMPMTLTQAAGLSGDGLTNAVSFLWFALIARGATLEAGELSRRELLCLGGLLIVLTLCKPTYVLLSPALLTLRWNGAVHKLWRWLYPALSGLAALSTQVIWTYANRSSASSGSNVMTEQLDWISAHPLEVLRIVPKTLFTLGDDYLIQFVAVRDVIHRDMRFIGGALGALYMVLLGAVSWGVLWRPPREPRERWWFATWLVLGSLATIGAIMLAMYLFATPTGATEVRGVQGRYFIPVAPALLLAISVFGRPALGRWLAAKGARRLQVAIILLNALCMFGLVGRYYVSPRIAWPY